MAATKPKPGRKTDMRHFTAFQDDATQFTIAENAGEELKELASRFPRAVSYALYRLGGRVRKRLRSAVEKGGIEGQKWPGLSDMREHRRMERLKEGEFPRGSRTRESLGNMARRWMAGGPKSTEIFGKAGRAIAFNQPKNKHFVEIGALSFSAARFLEAVQGGRRGSKGAFQYMGRQPVTPAMRRAMWAAGIPLAAETKTIGQEARPLMLPVFEEMRTDFEGYVVDRALEYLSEKGIDWVKP